MIIDGLFAACRINRYIAVVIYHTSTYFIKAQMPGTSLQDLLLLYQDELENEGAANIAKEEDTVLFSNRGFRVIYNDNGRFSSFSKGEIRITDTGVDYVVDFRGSRGGILFPMMIIMAVILLVFALMPGSGLSGSDILIVVVVAGGFGLAAFIRFLYMAVRFPVYFETLRNRIEQHVAAYR